MTDSIPDQKTISAPAEPYRQTSCATNVATPESGFVGLLRRLQRGQWGLALYKIAWRFPDWMFRFNQGTLIRIHVKPLPHRRSSGHSFSFANLADLDEITEITGHPINELTRRLQEGGECLITRDSSCNDRLINVQWMHGFSTYVKGLGFKVKINPGSAYTFGSYTVPSLRMKGVFQTALHKTISILKDRGVGTIYCLIERVNSASYSSHIRLGYEPVTRITHLVLLGLKITMMRDCTTGKRQFKVFFDHPSDGFRI